MPIRGSPNGADHPRPQGGRDHPEWVVAINRNGWSQSIGIAGRDHPVCAAKSLAPIFIKAIRGVMSSSGPRLWLVQRNDIRQLGRQQTFGCYR